MFHAEELHQIHHHLVENLKTNIRVHHSNAQPHRVSWFFNDINYVIEKVDDGYLAYHYHTPLDCKNIDETELPRFASLELCLQYIIDRTSTNCPVG